MKNENTDYRLVKNYGGEIGQICVLYINLTDNPMHVLWKELKRVFQDRIKEIYIATPQSIVITNNIERLGLSDEEKNQVLKGNMKWVKSKPDREKFEALLSEINAEDSNKRIDGIRTINFTIPDYIDNTDHKDTIWIQDYFLSFQNTIDDSNTVWKLYFNSTDSTFNSIAEYVGAHPPANFKGLVYSSFTEMEGGNMVTGDNFIITNSDVLLSNLERNKDISLNVLRERIKNELKVQHLIFADEHWRDGYGGFLIPDEIRGVHTDMYITLGHSTDDEQYIFVARLDDEYYTTDTRTIEDVFPMRSAMRETYEKIKEFFNKVADQNLKEIHYKFPDIKPFKIIRIPAILIYDPIFIDPRTRWLGLKKWQLQSYNNCIVEKIKDEPKPIIYIPVYGGPSANVNLPVNYTEVRKIVFGEYSKYFKVVEIDTPKEFNQLALQGGSLNCITKILYRKP